MLPPIWNQETEEEFNILKKIVLQMKEKLDEIPLPFKFMYRPPGHEFHMNLVDYLNQIEERLQTLEKNASDS